MQLLPPPGPERKRQLWLLAGLVIVLAIFFGRQYWPTTSAPAPASKEGTATSAKADDKQIVRPGGVNIGKTEPPPEASPVTRNPFQFGAPPPPPAPPYVP